MRWACGGRARSWRSHRRRRGESPTGGTGARPWGPAFLYSAVLLVGMGMGLAGVLEIRTTPGNRGTLAVLSGFLAEGETRLARGTQGIVDSIALHGLVETAIPMFAHARIDGQGESSHTSEAGGVRSFLLALSAADLRDPSTFLTIGIPGFRPAATAQESSATNEGARVVPAASRTPASREDGPPDETVTLEHPRAGSGVYVSGREPVPPAVVVPRPAPSTPSETTPRRAEARAWGDKPLVFIYHSHSSESYRLTSGTDHSWGSEDGVIAVGAALAKALSEKHGIPVLHSRKVHDYPVWREAYINSFKTVSDAIREHPSIEMVFDIHRDAGTEGLSAPPTVEIAGEKAARVFIVVTTDRFGLPHPNWRENLAFAYHLNATMDEMYPGLSRGINVRDDARWNQNVHNRAVILEIGCEQNTLREAERAATLVADVVASALEDIHR